MSEKKPRCHNCKHSSKQFKIDKLTHLHCQNEKIYTRDDFENNKISAWETLRVFNNSCNEHEFKETIKQ